MKDLKGNGFILRPLRLSDSQRYLECFVGENIKPFLLRVPRDLDEVQKIVRVKVNDFRKKKPFGESYAIEIEGVFAGYVELHNLNLEHQEHKCEIGYNIHPDYRGKGLATLAVRLLTKYAFEKYRLKRMSAMGRLKNKASARVLQKAGYKLEGVLRKNKEIDGVFYDDFIYAVVKK